MSASTTPELILSEETIDDLIYLARANELSDLQTSLTNLSTIHTCPPSTILAAAIDPTAGNTLLHYSAANGSVPIIQHLLSLLPPSPASTPTALAAAILDRKNSSGNTALHWAALNAHIEVVKALVGAGADPGVMNAVGRDAIVEAEMSGKEGADACAVWILEHWAGAEKGVGAEGQAEGEAAEANGADVEEATTGAKPA
jgi:uncharacterized protein